MVMKIRSQRLMKCRSALTFKIAILHATYPSKKLSENQSAKMNKAICFLATLFSLCITSCSKQDAEASIVGTWQWLRTDGGFAFHIHDTPASTGKNIDLKIMPNGKYAVYTNGALTSQGTYTLEHRQCIHDHSQKTFIQFSADTGLMVESLDNDHLEVSDEAHDGVGSSYQRK